MSPEAQRIAIAEACGWEEIHKQPYTDNLKLHFERLFGYPRIDGALCHEAEPLPSYLTDLNAMAEAEKVLTASQLNSYVTEYLGCPWRSDCSHHIRATTATAAQRAEAFLRTLSLWRESP